MLLVQVRVYVYCGVVVCSKFIDALHVCYSIVPSPQPLHNARVYQDRRGHLKLNMNSNNAPTAIDTAATTPQRTPVQQQHSNHNGLNNTTLSPMSVSHMSNQYMKVNGHQVLNTDGQRLAAATNAYELQKQAEVKAQAPPEKRVQDQ